MTLRRTHEIYLLAPVEEARHMDDPWQRDMTAERIVLRASGPAAARRLAVRIAADQGDDTPEAWLDPNVTICERLGEDGEPGVIAVQVTR